MDLHELKFARTHEWVRVEGNRATIGISEFAVQALTDLVYISLPPVGKKLTAGMTFGEVESVKAVSDLYAPLSGEVVASNSKVADDLGLLSTDPFGAGWLIQLQFSDAAPLGQLLSYTEYQAYCAAHGD